MDWTAPVFLYCERGTGTGLWAEPFNALSNLAFIAAAIAAYLEWRRGPREWPQGWLILGVFIVGIGSFLFHTHANAWSSLADIIPIGVVMISMRLVMLRRFLSAPAWLTITGIGAFVLAMAFALQVRCGGGECLNGSISYLPALVGLGLIGGILAVNRHRAAPLIVAATTVFAVSLTLRTVDRALCDSISLPSHPTGTHFLWHACNGLLLYLLLIATIRHGQTLPTSKD
jgi:Ceramidase